MLQLSSVAGGQYASVVMAAKPSGKFDTSIANLWTHCVSHDRNAERVYRVARCHRLKKKKRKIIIFEKYYKQYSRWSSLSLSLSLVIYDPRPHTCAKRVHAFETRKAFPPISKENLANHPRKQDRYPRNTAEHHAIFNAGNVEFENWCSNDSSHGSNGLKEPRVSPR